MDHVQAPSTYRAPDLSQYYYRAPSIVYYVMSKQTADSFHDPSMPTQDFMGLWRSFLKFEATKKFRLVLGGPPDKFTIGNWYQDGPKNNWYARVYFENGRAKRRCCRRMLARERLDGRLIWRFLRISDGID
jgi:hypothetical protein